MPDNFTTYGTSLYGKRSREIKSGIVFGAVATVLLFILAVFVIVNNLVFIKVKVSGRSMEPTFQTNDIVSVNVYRAPHYGDIIIISGEKSNGDWLIKRAIAFGGDMVKIEGGFVYLKKAGESDFGAPLEEKYLAKQGITFYPATTANTAPYVFQVAENQIFYLGDNRQNSSDSRSEFGTCERSQVVGVVSEFAVKTKGINKFFDNVANAIRDFFNF